MSMHHEVGEKGESLTVDYLTRMGYRILERNWRFAKAEIDIIAMDGDILTFIEVKTRSSTSFGSPDSFVNPTKEQLITDAALAYMEQIDHDWEVRFDIVSVLLRPYQKPDIKHIQDAFFRGV